MKSRLDKLPRYHSEETEIEASVFNLVKLSKIRSGQTLRFSVPELKNIDVILDDEYWACVDASLNDIPVFAWTAFETSDRDNLHKPIGCQLNTYHAHAKLIIDKVIEEIRNVLRKTPT